MQRWEYCEVTWQPDQILCNVFSVNGFEQRSLESSSWGQLLANLGSEGWELTGVTNSPKQYHEYFFYFKRPLAGSSGSAFFSPPPPPNPYL